METTKKSIVVMLALVVLTAATVYSGQEPAKPAAGPVAEISNTRTASCVVKVTVEAAIIALDEFVIESLLRSSGVAGKAAREVLGISPDDTSELFTIEGLTHSDSGGSGIPPASSRAPRGGLGDYETYEETGYDLMMDEEMMREEYEMPDRGSTPARSSRGRSVAPTDSRGIATSPTTTRTSRTPVRSTTAPTSARSTGGSYDYYYRSDGRRPADSYDGYYGYYGRSPTPATRPTRRTSAVSTTSADQTLLFRLSVDLPEGVKPAAKEFMDALIDNLEKALNIAYESCRKRLMDGIGGAEEQCEDTEEQLSKLKDELGDIRSTPALGYDMADEAVYKQLGRIVDLSALAPSMPFSEAIEEMKNSVDPPLKIVVLWRNLLEETEVEPTTEINMDGVGAVALGKGLELLLKAVSSGAVDEVAYAVDKGIITIAAAESLPGRLETWICNIPGLASAAVGDEGLVRVIQETVEPDSWYEAGGEGTIRIYMGKKLAILQTREVHLKIDKLLAELLQAAVVGASAEVPADVSVQMLLQERHSLLRDKQTLELDVARLEARRSAIEEQIPLITEKVDVKIHRDPIVGELQQLLDLQVQLLERTKELVKQGRVSHSEFADAEGKVARAKIELARRREELSKSAGGDQLAKFANDLTALTIELTETRAELQVLSKQLDQTQKQITAVSAFDPQVSKLRLVTQALEAAERRVNELETRFAYLQEPTVTVLGAD